MTSEIGWSGDAELDAGFGHAAAFDHREEDEQVAQPDAAADLLLPLDGSRHKEF